MQPPFRLYGAEHSAFSQKLLTYLRYKGFDHTYIPRTADNAAEFTRLARLPLVPLLVEADGRTAQDTTQIMERLDAAHPTPPARPEDPALGFLACLIEDWADEWLNKVSLHFRWADEADRMAAAQASVAAIYPNGAPEGAAEVIAARMAAKLPVAGAGPENGPALEAALKEAVALLDAHLLARPFLLGGLPSVADFALAAQLAQLQKDARSAAILREATWLTAYVARMQAPQPADGAAYESLEALEPTLAPLLMRQIGGIYLAFTEANAQAHAGGGSIALEIGGHAFSQGPQRYAGRAFQELRRKRAQLPDLEALSALLAATGCDQPLRMAVNSPPADAADGDADDDDGSGDDDQD
jgi:glutathione S-transferase